jgi:uncharacterized protein YifE (UPF0438 family)
MFIDLSTEQIKIILKHHEFMESLVSGTHQPVTDLQKRFISVAEGKTEASTEYELAYQIWKRSKMSLSVLQKEFDRLNTIHVESVALTSKQTGYRETGNDKTIADYGEHPSIALSLSERARLGAAPTSKQYLEAAQKLVETKSLTQIDRDQIPGPGFLPKDEPSLRFEEPWGSREDFKRDRASWKKSGR